MRQVWGRGGEGWGAGDESLCSLSWGGPRLCPPHPEPGPPPPVLPPPPKIPPFAAAAPGSHVVGFRGFLRVFWCLVWIFFFLFLPRGWLGSRPPPPPPRPSPWPLRRSCALGRPRCSAASAPCCSPVSDGRRGGGGKSLCYVRVCSTGAVCTRLPLPAPSASLGAASAPGWDPPLTAAAAPSPVFLRPPPAERVKDGVDSWLHKTTVSACECWRRGGIWGEGASVPPPCPVSPYCRAALAGGSGA